MKISISCLLVTICSEMVVAQSPLFELLQAERSGIDFQNTIVDDEEVNPFIYENMYAGAGVAIGDLNNDGLQDIFLAGNSVSDRLYLNKGKLLFEDIAERAGILDDDTTSPSSMSVESLPCV